MEEKRKKQNQELLEWYDALIFALALLVLVFAFCVRVVAVSGISMEPTLRSGDHLVVQSTFYTPKAGDVVVIDGYINYGKPLVKRVIACEGDVVDINEQTSQVTVNGQVLEEPYLNNATLPNGDVVFPVTVPKGCVFVMGDNRMHSTDSRSSDIGFIDERDILGKVLYRFFPLDRIGRVG